MNLYILKNNKFNIFENCLNVFFLGNHVLRTSLDFDSIKRFFYQFMFTEADFKEFKPHRLKSRKILCLGRVSNLKRGSNYLNSTSDRVQTMITCFCKLHAIDFLWCTWISSPFYPNWIQGHEKSGGNIWTRKIWSTKVRIIFCYLKINTLDKDWVH